MYNGGFLYNNYATDGFGYFAGIGAEALYDSDLALLVGPSRFNFREKPYEVKFGYTKDVLYGANLFSFGITYIFGVE